MILSLSQLEFLATVTQHGGSHGGRKQLQLFARFLEDMVILLLAFEDHVFIRHYSLRMYSCL